MQPTTPAQEGFLSWLSESDGATLSANLPLEELLVLLASLLPQRPHFSRLLARWKSSSTASRKSAEEAESWKHRGNESFSKGQWKEAARLYSMTALHAPQSSTLLPIAYANRSAALFELSLFQQCITDIDLSLDAGYPSKTRYKLFNRRAQCWVYLGFPADKIVNEFRSAEKEALEHGAGDFARKIRVGLDGFRAANGTSKSRQAGKSTGQAGRESSENNNVRGMLRIRYNPPERSLHTARNIHKGGVLIREDPYACVLRPKLRQTRCEYCLRDLDLNPVFCTTCTTVQYCSRSCRDGAQHAYHGRECTQAYLQDLEVLDVLTLRVYYRGQTDCVDGSCSVGSDILTEDLNVPVPGCGGEGRYVVSHATILTLLDHISSQPHSTLLHQAILFILLAQHLSLPPNTASELLHIWCKLRCNTFTIKVGVALVVGGDRNGRVQSVEEEVLGVGVYGRGSLLNHSCDPNSIVTFEDGGGLLVKSMKSLKEGEEVTISYGPLKSRMGRDDRRRRLREGWFFECLCEACSASITTDVATSHRCISSGCFATISPDLSTCPECGSGIDMEKRTKKLREADTIFEQAFSGRDTSKSLDMFQRALSIRETILHPHNRTLAKTYDKLAEWYAIRANFPTAAQYCRKGVEIIRVLDGEESAEVAREEFKLAQLLFNGRQVEPAMEAIERAIKSYEKSFGKAQSGEDLEELYAMRDCLVSLL